jgi:uncharacterized phage protein (TIGR02218 family)
MKPLLPALQAHLDSGATTLAWCWRLNRRDGVVLGFTDHDRDLTMDGVAYEAAAGFSASEIQDQVGFAVPNLEVTSALTSGRLTDADLASGLYDGAAVELWRVNWSDTSQRVRMCTGTVGEVRRNGLGFAAELRGLAAALEQPQGRLYQYTCDATLGDTRCGVALNSSLYTRTGTLTAVETPSRLVASGLSTSAADFFTRGVLEITSGPAIGRKIEIRRHALSAGLASFDLWQPLVPLPLVGNAIRVTAGCDKTYATCRDVFANTLSFRGFPHMPGNDFLTAPARPGEVNDGGALR